MNGALANVLQCLVFFSMLLYLLQAIVIRPYGAEPGPTVLMPHGGPHHAFLATYVMPLAFLARCGYTVVLVNFRGSTGAPPAPSDGIASSPRFYYLNLSTICSTTARICRIWGGLGPEPPRARRHPGRV